MEDNGGVHINSGIVSLAFKLLFTGRNQPAVNTNIKAESIGFDAAADIFYDANAECVTTYSRFYDACVCTVEMADGYYNSVRAAWDSVGVDEPTNTTVIVLRFGVTLRDQDGFLTRFSIKIWKRPRGGKVTCMKEDDNGESNLYL